MHCTEKKKDNVAYDRCVACLKRNHNGFCKYEMRLDVYIYYKGRFESMNKTLDEVC